MGYVRYLISVCLRSSFPARSTRSRTAVSHTDGDSRDVTCAAVAAATEAVVALLLLLLVVVVVVLAVVVVVVAVVVEVVVGCGGSMEAK
jgi:uncharacterized membrane protein